MKKQETGIIREKPILFQTDMVRAIQGGIKTQTRRLNGLHRINKNPDDYMFMGFIKYKNISYAVFRTIGTNNDIGVKSHYEINMKLWVRETFTDHALIGTQIEKRIIYKASNSKKPNWCKWKPSIFMPRSASRITLEITNIRVERLQDITIDDAIREGIERSWDGTHFRYKNYQYKNNSAEENAMFKYPSGAIDSFRTLWDSINRKRGYGWTQNPWVFVYEFKDISKRSA